MLMTWGQAGGANSLQPQFDLPILTTVVPISSGGSSTPTFTRATTATVEDFEGLVRPVLSGEVRFQGARRVYNLVSTKSEDWTSAAWTKTTTTATATTLTATAGNATTVAASAITSASQLHVLRVRMSRITGTGNIQLTLDNGATWTSVTLTGSAQVFSVSQTLANPQPGIRIVTNGDAINADQIQIEATSGQSNTNPSEYVSVGVLSAPYHGAGVDGVKYFDYENGNTVASNVVTEATGVAISTSTLLGYKREPASTNLALRSQELDNASWTLIQTTVTANNATAPDGTTTAEKWQQSAPSIYPSVSQTVAVTASQTYTLSAFLKAGTQTKACLELRYNAGDDTTEDVEFDLSAVTATPNGASTLSPTGTIKAVGNGWYRATLTKTAPLGATQAIAIARGGAISTDVNGTNLYIWGAQLEALSFATSYIPTTTAAVTRNADVLSYPTAGNYSATAGAIYAEVTRSGTAQADVIGTGGGAGNLPLYLTATQVGFFDGTTASLGANYTASETAPAKVACTYGGSAAKTFAAGAASAALPFDGDVALASVGIGVGFGVASELAGTIRNVKIWTISQPNSVLVRMTA